MTCYDVFFWEEPFEPGPSERYHWLRSLNLSCKAFNFECYRLIYHTIILDILDEDVGSQYMELLRSISTRPHIARHVRRLELDFHDAKIDEDIRLNREAVLKTTFAAMHNLESLVFNDQRLPGPDGSIHHLGFQLGNLTSGCTFQLLFMYIWYPRRMDLDLEQFLASQSRLVQLELFLPVNPGEPDGEYFEATSLDILPRLRELHCTKNTLSYLPYTRPHLESLYLIIPEYDTSIPSSPTNTTLTHLALNIKVLRLLSVYLPHFPNITSLQIVFHRWAVSHVLLSSLSDS